MRNPNILPTRPAKVRSFGPGGQIYAANLVGGFKLKTGLSTFNFFDISESNPDPWAPVLTNLKEAQKIGNSMTFLGKQYAFRIAKVDGTITSAAEVADLIKFMMGSRLELYIGSNQTKISELDLAHFLSVANFATDSASVDLPINTAAWVSLAGVLQQPLEPNTEISGKVFCNLPTGCPASLGLAVSGEPKFIFKFIMAGEKQAK